MPSARRWIAFGRQAVGGDQLSPKNAAEVPGARQTTVLITTQAAITTQGSGQADQHSGAAPLGARG